MMKVSEVAAATGAEVQDFEFTGITTDSRTVKPGELFIALTGANFDGHDYCVKALELGALGVVISHEVKNLPAGAAVFMVEDTLKAYQQLAHAYRMKQQKLKVFAITGSNGKTSTKDLLAACLETKYRVVKTQENFNNEIGLPKTLLDIQPDTEIAVVEMGMCGFGQIAELCRIARPDSGLITNVGESHMEFLGSRENIGKAKSEIVADLPEEGFAVLNGDNEYAVKAAGQTRAKVIYFGLGENCDYHGSAIETSFSGTKFICTDKASGTSVQVCMDLIGEHNVYNALGAMAAAACYGVAIEDSARALAAVRLSSARQEIHSCGDITVINDAYNASPASMEAAFKTLREARKAASGSSRTIAVLADMLELGPVSEDAHRRVGRFAVEYGVDHVLTYGREAAYINEEINKLGGSSVYYENRQQAGEALRQLAAAGDIILLKGSHSMHVEKLLEIFK